MTVSVVAFADESRSAELQNVHDASARVFDVLVNDVLCTTVTYDATTREFSAPRVSEGKARASLQTCVRRAVEHESLAASNAAFASTRSASRSSVVHRLTSDNERLAAIAVKLSKKQALTVDEKSFVLKLKQAHDAAAAAAAASASETDDASDDASETDDAQKSA